MGYYNEGASGTGYRHPSIEQTRQSSVIKFGTESPTNTVSSQVTDEPWQKQYDGCENSVDGINLFNLASSMCFFIYTYTHSNPPSRYFCSFTIYNLLFPFLSSLLTNTSESGYGSTVNAFNGLSSLAR